jgi:hypothetical protein
MPSKAIAPFALLLCLAAGHTLAGGGGNATNVVEDAKDFFEQDGVIVVEHDSWLQTALDLQNKLDYEVPLAQASFVMTHNSYNSKAYYSGFAYVDPNQNMSISEQLNAGTRSLEFDVHQYFSMHGWPWNWRKRLMLCHGQNNHMGCSSYDRHLESGFDEVRDWLNNPKNQKEVIVIYIEDHMDGNYRDAINIISSRIGSKIYRPSGTGCQGIPMNITKQAIIDAGKQVLLMGAGDVCSSNSGWDTWAFSGVGNRNGYPTGSVDAVTADNCDFSRDFYDKYWVRFYEDRTTISALFGDPSTINDDDVINISECGATLIGLDKLDKDDSRLHAAIWSWDAGEPNNWNNNEDCAMSSGNHRWNDASCGSYAQYACQKPGTHEWYVTFASGTWEGGENVCSRETGGQYRFAVPTNGFDNKKLREAKQVRGANDTWIKYHDRNIEGHWEAN